MWLRVAALAFGNHEDNGHAKYKRGRIALVLGKVNPESGEVEPYTNVGRAIQTAVEYGWLAPESFWGCLVVPAHAVKKGEHGHNPVCPVHRRRRREGRETLTERALRVVPTTTSERFRSRSAHSVTGSEREALSSPLPTATHAEGEVSA